MNTAPNVLCQLRRYYADRGIGALDFNCQHYPECSADSPEFTTAQETYVGPEYGAAQGLPRLVFVSLDSGSHNEKDPAQRTLEAVRRHVLARDLAELNKGRHWYLTHLMAWEIFRAFQPTMRLERVNRFFAHVNAAKCCQNKPGRAKADALLFANCRGFIPGEIRILQPDVIVTQGSEAKDALDSLPVLESERSELCDVRVVSLGQAHLALWLLTYHPRYYGRFWSQKNECWPKYVSAAVDFMRSHRMDTTMTTLEGQFHEAMLRIYEDEKSVRPHDASRFRQMIANDGGLQAAKKILRMPGVTQGFTELYLAKRVDLTVEALVLREPWRRLFTADELAIAQKRLDEVTSG